MRKLSTHVLDTAHGRPAAGMAWQLARCDAHGPAGSPAVLAAGKTNADGRTDAPLLVGEELLPGVYQLSFEAGAYFRDCGVVLPEPAFLDTVILRFGVAAGDVSYHVPLLVSPWSWSSYRGS